MVMDIVAIMKERHSVRQYKKSRQLNTSKREKNQCVDKDVNAESKLSIQVFLR